MKKNLLEYALGSLEVIEERKNDKDQKELDVQVKWQEADIVNQNNRLYGRALLEREIKRIQSEIDAGATIWGHGFHPADGLGKAQDISHKWKKVWLEDDGTAKGILTIVPTEAGNNVSVLIKAGKLGISSRGFGSTTEREDIIDGKKVKYLEVNDDFKLKTPGDFVVAPAVAGAGNLNEEISNLEVRLNGADTSESNKREENVKNKKKGFSLERLDEIMLNFFKRDKDFRGSFADWQNQHALPIYARAMVDEGLASNTEEALKMLNVDAEHKEPRRKVSPKDVIFEAQIAGISAIELAKKINAGIDREIAEAKNNLTMEQRVKILREAYIAGIDIHSTEERAKILTTARKQKGKVTTEKPKPLTDGEKKSLLHREKMTAGYRNSLLEPEK